MPRRDNSKILTFVEVIIVVFVCLFLLAIVPPAYRKTRTDASRITCGRNLSMIGKAMTIYANDYDGKLPRAGGRNSMWAGFIPNWMADNRFAAYGLGADGSRGSATITSSFYLLVKYAGLAPKTFICPGDDRATEFNPADDGAGDRNLVDLWDFGASPSKHCSYSYHMPYGLYALTTSSEPGMAVAADRNPWINSPTAEAKDPALLSSYNPEGGKEAVKIVNAIAHQEEGQNVLFLDGHVNFEESPLCGINDDNIYTFWDGGDIRVGGFPIPGMSEAQHRSDSFLVNESAPYIVTVTKQAESLDSANLKKTSIVATLDCPVPEHKNVIWCSTFQMAWDRLKNDIIGEPVKIQGAEELAARLNQAEASEADLEEESFYATAGFVGKGIIKQIQNEMKKRFPSESVPVFNEIDQLPPFIKEKTIVSYSYLNANAGFKHPFFVYKKGFNFEDSYGTRSDVKAFCARASSLDTNLKPVRGQVEILYYKHGQQRGADEFVVDLCKHTEPYQVILARVPQCKTFREQIAAVEEKISEFKHDSDYKVLSKLRPIDSLIVPDILYKLTHQFTELKDKYLGNQPWFGYYILEALQMIDFALSRTGVTIKSQARLTVASMRRRLIEEPRYFYFNRPFLIYVKKRQEGTNPFFVMWVDNAELMNEFESK